MLSFWTGSRFSSNKRRRWMGANHGGLVWWGGGSCPPVLIFAFGMFFHGHPYSQQRTFRRKFVGANCIRPRTIRHILWKSQSDGIVLKAEKNSRYHGIKKSVNALGGEEFRRTTGALGGHGIPFRPMRTTRPTPMDIQFHKDFVGAPGRDCKVGHTWQLESRRGVKSTIISFIFWMYKEEGFLFF